MKTCPKCGGDAILVYGLGWDWDREWCLNRDCDYDVELDTMTCVEPDGSLYVIKKEEDDEDDDDD